MALSKEDMATLKKDLMAVRGKKVGFFLYCAGGADGDPVLMVSKKKIQKRELSNLKMTARKKKFVQGDLLYQPKPGGGESVFYFLGDKPSALFQKHIKTFFAKAFAKLKKSVFELSEEGQQEEARQRSRGSEGAAQREPASREQDDLQVEDARESGLEKSKLDDLSISRFQDISDPAILCAQLAELKLGDINFERLDISNKSKDQQKELYAQQEKELDQRVDDLEALLRIAYAARIQADQEEQEALAEYGRMKREKKDKTKRSKYKAVVIERRKNASDLLDRENEIRALLQVAHAQRQNCILDREEVCDAMVENAAEAFLSKEDLTKVQKAAEEQEIRCNACQAEVKELEETLELLQKEERSTLRSIGRKEEVAKKKGKKEKYEEKAEQRLKDLQQRKEKIMNDLSIREKELDKEKALMLLRQAKSNEYLDQWSQDIKSHWDQKSKDNDTDIQALAEKDQALKKELQELREVDKSVKALANKKEEKEKEIADLKGLKESVEAKLKVQEDKLQLITEAISKAGYFTNKSGLKAEKAKIEAQLATLKEEQANATDEAKTKRLSQLEKELSDIKEESKSAQEKQKKLQSEVAMSEKSRNALLLSDKEREMSEILQAKTTAAQKLVESGEEKVQKAEEKVQDAEAKLKSYTDAEKKRERAMQEVFEAEALFRSVRAEAKKTRMGGKARKASIDAARAELPLVSDRLRLAQEALEKANGELNGLKGSLGKDLHQEMESLKEARKELLKEEQQLCEARAHQCELEKQKHEQNAQVAALAEDVFREQREKQRAKLVESLEGEEGEAIQELLKEAKTEKAAANKELAKQVNLLVDLKLQIAELHQEIKTTENMDKIVQLTVKQKELTKYLQAQNSIVEEKEKDLAEAKKKNQDAKAKLLEHAKELEKGTGSQAELARDLLVSEDAFKHAKAEQKQLQEAVIDSQKQAEQASKEKQDARRKENLVPLQTEMKELLLQKSTKDLLEKFHHVSEDLKEIECLDLLSAADQKKIKADNTKKEAYEQLLLLQEDLNEKAMKMIAKGATKDDLEQAFADIPNTLRPASYRAEIARFDEIQEMLSNAQLQEQLLKEAEKLAAKKKEDPKKLKKQIMDSLKEIPGKEAADFLAEQMELFDTLTSQGLLTDANGNFALDYSASQSADSSTTTGLKNVAGVNSSSSTQMDDIRSINSQITSGYELLKNCASLLEYTKVDVDVLDPVERLEHEEKMFDLMSDATSASLQATSNFAANSKELMKNVPIINLFSIVDDGKGMIENIVKTGARRLNESFDQYLGMAAKASGSALAGAFEESQKQESQLKLKYGIKSLHSVAGITADVLSVFPGTAAVGAILGAVNTVAGWISGYAMDKKVRSQMMKAKNLLDKANQGDEEAKVELFKNHALYAKGLIAHMAEQNDSFALSYVKKRGLSQEAVEGSSKEIVMRYLLNKAEQNEEDYDDDKLGSLSVFGRVVAGGKRALSAIGSLFGSTLYNLQYDKLIQQTEKFEDSITQLKPLYKQTDIAMKELEKKKKGANEKRVKHLDKKIKKIQDYKESFLSLQTEGIGNLQTHLKEVAKAKKSMDELLEKEKEGSLSPLEKSTLDGYKTIVPVSTSSLKNCLLSLTSFG